MLPGGEIDDVRWSVELVGLDNQHLPNGDFATFARLLVGGEAVVVNNDRSTKEVAAALDIQAAAVWRMNQLLNRELIRRVKRGYYRPVE